MKFQLNRRLVGSVGLSKLNEATVQERPTLGGMGRTRRRKGWWLLPLLDATLSTVVVIAILTVAGLSSIPAFPVAPLLLILAYSVLGVYRADAGVSGHHYARGWVAVRLLVAALFAWSVGMLAPLGSGGQIALFALFVLADFSARATLIRHIKHIDPPERWVLVGDELTAARLRAFKPLAPHAMIAGVVFPDEESSRRASRSTALAIVEQFHADRVVIATNHADDNDLVNLMRAFKSIGVCVSLMPRPLDLLEAPSVKSGQFGGVPLIEVGALASKGRQPYVGPERRQERGVKVSVVVPSMNEEKNIAQVLKQLPRELHEVILVDGRSTDNTVAAAERARPGIRVVRQQGRGKGDALRSGFAAVTGNAVVMLDADGSADPSEIPGFIAALEAGADFAKGSRYLGGGGSDDITRLRKLGNTVLSGTANVLHGTKFTDLCYGYNAFWARCLPFISLDVPGFEVETLINLRVANAGMKITEVPSYELERIHGSSNLNTFRDGFRVLKTILLEAHRSRAMRSTSSEGDGGSVIIRGREEKREPATARSQP